jgi:hypothetical protein
MTSRKTFTRYISGIALVIGVNGPSPLLAHGSSKSIQVVGAAVGAGTNSSITTRQKLYCITETVNSRIPRPICKTEKDWFSVGVDLIEK